MKTKFLHYKMYRIEYSVELARDLLEIYGVGISSLFKDTIDDYESRGFVVAEIPTPRPDKKAYRKVLFNDITDGYQNISIHVTSEL